MQQRLHRTAAALLAAGFIGLGFSGGAAATALPYKDIVQLATEADGIVIGTVRALQTVVTSPGEIHTYVSIQPQEVLSGRLAQRELTLQVLGGFDGQRGVHIVGAPQFQAGERVLLFVQGNGRDLVPFVGWGQGVFRLQRDDAGVERVLDVEGQRVVGVQGRHLLRDGAAASPGSEARPHVHVVGAPPVTLMREAAVQADAGQTDDGSAVQMQRIGAAPLAAMPALPLAQFIAEVQRHAGSGGGRELASVQPGETRAQAEGRAEASTQPAAAAGHPLARPAEGGVAEPVRRPQAPSRAR
jgi:hypothetical protein